jgi:hypothetical protein
LFYSERGARDLYSFDPDGGRVQRITRDSAAEA